MRETGQPDTWHRQRAENLERGEVARQTDCGVLPRGAAACPCCRKGYKLARNCGSRWCTSCAERLRLRMLKKLRRSLGAAERRAWDRWRQEGCLRRRRPSLRLLTLTGPHSGNLAYDHARLLKAWARCRAWLHKNGVKPDAFVVRHELTAGTDGRGHWHMHVAYIGPWLDYQAFRHAWARALEYVGAAPPDWGRDQANRRVDRVGIDAAAHYVAKYIAKPCPVDDPQLAADFYATSYARRLTHASDHFWSPIIGCCGAHWHHVRVDEWERMDSAVESAISEVTQWETQRQARPPPPLPRNEIAKLAANV